MQEERIPVSQLEAQIMTKLSEAIKVEKLHHLE